MEGDIRMSRKERKRLEVMSRVKSKGLRLIDGAEILEISYRQSKRIYRRYRQEGSDGLVHKLRDRRSNHGAGHLVREQVVGLLKDRYVGFGPTFAAEKLEEDGYSLSRETVRQWLIASKLPYRTRDHKKYRKRRPRKEHFGEMVQMDGSHHPWFENRGGKACMMNMIDDATNITYAQFDREETTDLAMKTLWGWIKEYGVPASLYTDRKTVFWSPKEPSLEEQLTDQRPLTQFGMVCQRLGIKLFYASSPQAKGRIERSNGIHQDRLVKELRLANISSIDQANRFLTKTYLPKLNHRFAKLPLKPEDYHRPAPKPSELRNLIGYEEPRSVSHDWTIQYKNKTLQLTPNHPCLPNPKSTVWVFEQLDGALRITYKGHSLNFTELSQKPKKEEMVSKVNKELIRSWRPAPNHPWRHHFKQPPPRAPLGGLPPKINLTNFNQQGTFLNG